MKNAQRVVWSEGMFMSPHHMQQLDLYHENLLDLRLGAVEPYPWGVVSVEFDMEALRAGRVQVVPAETRGPVATNTPCISGLVPRKL